MRILSARVYWILIPALVAGSGRLFAQVEIERTERLSLEQGLSDQNVHDLRRDTAGFLWLATDLGLDRYDGYRFEHFKYRTGSAQRLHGRDIVRIGESASGELYLRYRQLKFVDLFHTGRFDCVQLPLDSANGLEGEVREIYLEPRGALWALSTRTDTLWVWQFREGKRFRKMFGLPWKSSPQEQFKLLRAKNGECWIFSSVQGLWCLNATGEVLQHLENEKFKLNTAPDDEPLEPGVFYEDGSGRFWISFKNVPGLYFFQRGVSRRADFAQQTIFTRVWEDGRGNLLFASPDPDDRFVFAALLGLRANGERFDAGALLGVENKIQTIFADDFDRQIFLGTYSGLYKVFLKNKGIRQYLARDLKPGEFGAIVRSIVSDGRGKIYFALEERNWYGLDTRTQRLDTLYLTDAHGQPLELTCSGYGLAYDPAGFLWGMGCLDQGKKYALYRYDLARKTTRSWLVPGHLVTFCRLADGRFCLLFKSGGEGGEIGIFDPRTGKYAAYSDADGTNPFASRLPKYILPSRRHPGLFWIGTSNGLVAVALQRRVTRIYGVNEADAALNFSHPDVQGVSEDEAGTLWLGTDGGGLNIVYFDRQAPANGEPPRPLAVKIVDLNQGLINNQVYGALPDGDGGCVMSTNLGLSRYHPATQLVGNFFKQDGLTHNEFNRPSFFKDETGRFYFGTINGLNVFQLPDLLGQRPRGKIRLTKLTKYFGKAGRLEEQVTGLGDLRELVIEPEVSYFQLEFILTDYAGPEKNQFFAWLEGQEKDWNYLGHTHTLRYNRLPAGEYTLHLRGADAQGNLTDSPLALHIRSKEFFYRTGWFLGLVALFLLGASGAFVQWRIRYIRAEDKRRDALNARLADLEVRALQAQMNPHFIFNCLNSIQSLIAEGDKENAMRYVARFAQLTRSVLHFSGKSTVGLDEEIAALGHYIDLECLRAGHPIRYRLEVAPDIDTFDVELPPMLVQPFVENSFKHGKISELTVLFQRTDGHLTVLVRDDGVGLQEKANRLHRSKGIALTRERLAFWNGRSDPADLQIVPQEKGLLVTMNILLK